MTTEWRNTMKLIIGSDKSGFMLKESITAYLQEQNISYVDVGTTDIEQPKPFFNVVPVAVKMMENPVNDRAILICGTGMGMSQVANKFKGIFAACCESVFAAKMCRAINNSNVLCLGGWIVGPEMGVEMTKVFLNTEHTQDLEEWRKDFLKKAVVKISEIDAANIK